MPNQLIIVGLPSQHEANVRSLVAAMAPEKLPQNGIAFLDPKTYDKMRWQVQNGEFGGQRIGRTSGDGGDETYGGGFQNSRTNLGDSFTIGSIGRTYVNSDVLKRPDKLAGLLAHELGHINASNDSEGAADRNKALYLQRAQQAQKIWNGAQQLPDNAMSVLSGALKGIQATPASPLVEIAGTQSK